MWVEAVKLLTSTAPFRAPRPVTKPRSVIDIFRYNYGKTIDIEAFIRDRRKAESDK